MLDCAAILCYNRRITIFISMAKRKTNEEYLEELRGLMREGCVLEGPYIGTTTKMWAICTSCHHWWELIPAKLKARGTGSSCPTCQPKARKIDEAAAAARKERQLEEVKAALAPDITVLGAYVNTTTRIPVQCNKCNHTWEVTPAKLKSRGDGSSCCNCAGKTSNGAYTQEGFTAALAKLDPDLKPMSPYTGSASPMRVQHTCGHEWEVAVAGDLLRSEGASTYSARRCQGCSSRIPVPFTLEEVQARVDLSQPGEYKVLESGSQKRCTEIY